MLISLNRLFSFLDWDDVRVKTLKLQRQTLSGRKELTKNEYERLVLTARRNGNGVLS